MSCIDMSVYRASFIINYYQETASFLFVDFYLNFIKYTIFGNSTQHTKTHTCWYRECAGAAPAEREAKDKPAPAKRASPHHLPASGFQPYRPDER